jgi:hypothetical protein
MALLDRNSPALRVVDFVEVDYAQQSRELARARPRRATRWAVMCLGHRTMPGSASKPSNAAPAASQPVSVDNETEERTVGIDRSVY